MKTGLVFGTFDGLHEGHRAMFKQARDIVDQVVVALPSDEAVLSLKGKAPKYTWKDRSSALAESRLVDEIISGDEEIGAYKVIAQINPEVVFVGYDQTVLQKDLEEFFHHQTHSPEIITLNAYYPERYKSSLLNSL
ncbi:MAG: adenylyltransferase/cytidyltransferase family protein [Patescibacteria group bacterium]|jgi:cytidyltransferase-like protein